MRRRSGSTPSSQGEGAPNRGRLDPPTHKAPPAHKAYHKAYHKAHAPTHPPTHLVLHIVLAAA